MASILRARKKGDGAGGGDGRKRLSTVDEGDEAAELAKLAAAEEDVRRLQEEIEAVQAKLDDVEAMREAWMDDPDGVFDSLKPGMRRAYKNADGYFTFLEKERDRLSAKEDALNNRMGGSLHDKGGQANIVAEIKSQKTNVGRFKVSGRLIGSQRVKGVRRYVYSAVSNNAGYAVVKEGDATAHRTAIRYEGIDLVFDIVFTTHRDASMFTNEVAPTAFGFSSDDIEIDTPEVVKFDNIQSIRSWDYRSDDEQDSARCGDSDSTVYTTVEPDGDLAKFQSIEIPILLRNGSADCAHLVHKSAVEVEGIDDNDNNRLVLSSTLHHWFDGRRNQHGYARNRFPRFMIEPAPELVDGDYSTVTDSIGEVRERAWIKVSCFEPIDCEVISFNIKEGTKVEKREGGFVEYLTFVHVLDRDQFYSNLEWKAAETRSVWEDARSRR